MCAEIISAAGFACFFAPLFICLFVAIACVLVRSIFSPECPGAEGHVLWQAALTAVTSILYLTYVSQDLLLPLCSSVL